MNKTALITGVGRGIGKALALRFLSAGDFVIGTYLKTKPDYTHEHLTLLPLDLTDSSSIRECVESVTKLGKKIDILINNAGALFDEDDTEVVIDKLRKTLEVNLIGTVDFTEQVLSIINKNSHIINISSRVGSHAMEEQDSSHNPYHYPAYRISKAALNMYTVTLSRLLEQRKIIVSSVHPGWVRTDMGGQEADITPEEAAENIYEFANSQPASGQFWFKGKQLPW